jgi:hypothetical protein
MTASVVPPAPHSQTVPELEQNWRRVESKRSRQQQLRAVHLGVECRRTSPVVVSTVSLRLILSRGAINVPGISTAGLLVTE